VTARSQIYCDFMFRVPCIVDLY